MDSDSGNSDAGHAHSGHDDNGSGLCASAIDTYNHAMTHLSSVVGQAIDQATAGVTGTPYGDTEPVTRGEVVESAITAYSASQQMQAACQPGLDDNN